MSRREPSDSDGPITFRATIEAGRGGGALVSLPFDVEEVYRTRGRVAVAATFDGHVYRGSIAPMGGRHILGVTKAVRAAIGKDVGDSVEVFVQRDTAERTVDVPPELGAALRAAPDAREAFQGLSYTHRREFAEWVADAKKQDTRDRRAGKVVAMVREGKTL